MADQFAKLRAALAAYPYDDITGPALYQSCSPDVIRALLDAADDLDAIKTFAEDCPSFDDLRAQRDRLAAALRDVFALIDEGWLVRDTSHDSSDGWAMRNLKYVRRLAAARAALAELEAQADAEIDRLRAENERLDGESRKFLAQFEASKKNIEGWPKWMQDSARESSASFPRSDEASRNLRQPVEDALAELKTRPAMRSDQFAELRQRINLLGGAFLQVDCAELSALLDAVDERDSLQRTFAEHTAAETMRANRVVAQRDKLAELVRIGEQVLAVASDWNLDEIEIDGEMIDTSTLHEQFRAALAELEKPNG